MRIYGSRYVAGSVVAHPPLETALLPHLVDRSHLPKRLTPHLKFDKAGFLLTEKLPTILLDKLSPGEIIDAQMLLLTGRGLQIARRVSTPGGLHDMREFLRTTLSVSNPGSSILRPFRMPRPSGWHHPHVLSCEQLLLMIEEDLSAATTAAGQVDSAMETANNLLLQGQAATDPSTQLADATAGLALLSNLSVQASIADNALAEAMSLIATAVNKTPPCSPDVLNQMNTILGLIQAQDQAANVWTGNWIGLVYFLGLWGSLQQLQQQATASLQALPPSCFEIHNDWWGQVDIKLNETCTQQLVNDLKGGAGILQIFANAAAALGGVAIGIISSVYGGYAALIQADIGNADLVRHQGVTLHVSFAASILSPPGTELVVLAGELISPGFGAGAATFWITPN